jgi:hypothetical protein
MNRITLLLLLLTITSCLNAQDRNVIGVNFIYGAKVLNQFGTYKGFGVSYNISTVNNKAEWTKILNVKNINIDAVFNDLGNIMQGGAIAAYDPKFRNKQCFGNSIALSGSIDVGLINSDAFKVLFSPGLGLIYYTKNYFNTGGVNQVVGCHLNAIGSATIKLVFPVTEDLSIQLGESVSHSSNSNTNSPNVGLDRIESFIGITQGLDYPNNHTPKFSLKQNSVSVDMIVGYTTQVTTGFYQLKGIDLRLDNSYRKQTTPIAKAALSLSYNHYLNEVVGVKIGTDFVYSNKTSPLGSSTSDTTRFIQTYQGKYTPVYNNLNVGLTTGIDMCLGRFVFSGAYGYYLGGYEHYIYKNGSDKFEYGREFYITFAARYYVTPNLALEAKSYLSNFAGLGVNLSF